MPENNLKMSVTFLSRFDQNLQRMYYTCFEDTWYFYSNFLFNAKKSLKSALAWSRSLLCRIVVKLHFQLLNNVDIFSQWMAISQEDISKRKRLTGGMQRAGCRTVVFGQQNKGSVWLNLLNWSEPQKKNNDYYDIRHVGWVCCWFLSLLREFPLGPPVFLPSQEQTFLIPMETVERRATSWNVYC